MHSAQLSSPSSSVFIQHLRLPLMVAIVCIHAWQTEVIVDGHDLVQEGQLPFFSLVKWLLIDVLCNTAVPLFACFSGFLFFANTSQAFPLSTYWQKLQHRGRSLLLPYLLWNTIILILTAIGQTLLPSLAPEGTKMVMDFRWSDFLYAFWDMRQVQPTWPPYPICYQFWFLRDIMLLGLATPLLWLGFRQIKGMFLLFCMALYVWVPMPTIVNPQIAICFTFGAYCAISQRNIATFLLTYRYPLLGIAVLSNLSTHLFPEHLSFLFPHLPLLNAATLLAFAGAYFRYSKAVAFPWTTSACFFLYAAHALPLRLLSITIERLFNPHTDLALLASFVGRVAFTTVLCLGLYKALHTYAPTLCQHLTGNRTTMRL